MFGRIATWAVSHARGVLVALVVLALGAGVGATRLPVDTGVETLVDSNSASARATEGLRERFGDDPIVVLAEGRLRNLVLTDNLLQLLRLEGCLAANPPRGAKPLPGPCTELAELAPTEFVIGPATFLNQAATGIQSQLVSELRRAQRSPAALQRLFALAARYGLTGIPQLGDPNFVSRVVFDPRTPKDQPKSRLAYLFPNDRAAQIVVRLRDDLSDADRERALELIREAVDESAPRRACAGSDGKPAPCFALSGGRYVLSGAPVVVDGLAAALRSALLALFALAVVAMALVLFAVFRSRLRLLPLGLALGAAALTFGLFGLLGGSLTLASIAVLPVLIGLAVDYAIQLQARYDEAIAAGERGPAAACAAAARGGPVVGTACLATIAGFLALQLSPAPTVRGFGALLAVGVAIAFGLALTAGFAALSLRREPEGGGDPGGERALGESSRAVLALAISRPRRVLVVGIALAVAGWAAGTTIGTVTDIRELAPQDLPEVRALNELQDATGVSGQLDVSVRAPDLTDPALIAWMAAFKQRVLEQGGFTGNFPSCRRAEVCPGPAISDFAGSGELTRQRVRALYGALPAYELRPLVSFDGDGPGGTAALSFGIRAQSLASQQRLIDEVRGQIAPPGEQGPPAGVEVTLAGLPVLAAESASELDSSRYWVTLAALAAVALVLLAVYRSARRSLLPLVPIVLATGWSALVLAAAGVRLNPLSAVLGALVIAIATEFSVILSARYHEERDAGRSVGEALRAAYSRTGAAVFASATTVLVGFAVLAAVAPLSLLPGLGDADFPLIRDFGLVAVVDLAVALLGVMVVLPAALVQAEDVGR